MGAAVMKILAVGGTSPYARAVLERLARRGWVSSEAETLWEARALLETFEFDVALCAENLADGKGYDLLHDAKRQRMALLVEIELSGASLWLPVVDQGGSVIFGERAIHASALEGKLEGILSAGERRHAREAIRPAQSAEPSLVAGGGTSQLRVEEESGVHGKMAPVPAPASLILSDEAGRSPEPVA